MVVPVVYRNTFKNLRMYEHEYRVNVRKLFFIEQFLLVTVVSMLEATTTIQQE
jgi:hypothetical protein